MLVSWASPPLQLPRLGFGIDHCVVDCGFLLGVVADSFSQKCCNLISISDVAMYEVRHLNVGHEVLNLVMFRINVEIGHHDLGVDLDMAWTKAVMIATLRGD